MSIQPDPLIEGVSFGLESSVERVLEAPTEDNSQIPLHTRFDLETTAVSPSMHLEDDDVQLECSGLNSTNIARASFGQLPTEIRLSILRRLGPIDLENMRLTSRQGLTEADDITKTYSFLNCLDGRGIPDYSPISATHSKGFPATPYASLKTLAIVTGPGNNRRDCFYELGRQIHPNFSSNDFLDMAYIHFEPSESWVITNPADLLDCFAGTAFAFSGMEGTNSCIVSGSRRGLKWPYKPTFKFGIQIMTSETLRSCMFGYLAQGGPELVHIIKDTLPTQDLIESMDFLLERVIELETGQNLTVALTPPNNQKDCVKLEEVLIERRRASVLAGRSTEEAISRLTVRLVDASKHSSLGQALRWEETVKNTMSEYRRQQGLTHTRKESL